MVVEYLGDASSPRGSIVSTKASPLAAAAALTTDSSTWGGSTTYKYKLQASFFPNQAGPVKVTVYLGTPSLTGVYVDPKITIT